jgi:hypothetical protein
MISRRYILKSGLAATSLPLVASLPLVSTAATPSAVQVLSHPSLYRVIFDQRFAASRNFGAEARWQGHSVQGFNGDITNVWFNDLRPRWKAGPAAIAGFTAHGALFCLEQLAWDVGMRVVERTELTSTAHEPLYTWVIAPLSSSARRSRAS